MKILFSTDQIYLHGGLEKVMAQKANYFSEVLHYDVFILTTEQLQKPPCYHLNPTIKLIDIKVNYVREKSYLSKQNLKKIVTHYTNWNATIKSINPDVLIVCNQAFDMFWIPFRFPKILKIREFHSSRFAEETIRVNGTFFQKIKFKITDFIESKFDKLVVLNKDEKAFYKTSNTVVIPNPIAKETRVANLINKQAIAAGRIAPVKNFEHLIEVWKLVVNKYPEWELHIYGQGEKDAILSLQNKIKSLQLEKNVIIKDPTDTLITTMLEHSFYVMTSHTECFPMVLLESLSIGLPIVSYDCPTGPRNIIKNNENGFLVTNKDSTELVEKIGIIIEDEKLRTIFGRNAIQSCAPFYVDEVMQQWNKILQIKKN